MTDGAEDRLRGIAITTCWPDDSSGTGTGLEGRCFLASLATVYLYPSDLPDRNIWRRLSALFTPLSDPHTAPGEHLRKAPISPRSPSQAPQSVLAPRRVLKRYQL